MPEIIITVPIPKLNPNNDFAGWAAKSAQKKQDREIAIVEAQVAVAELEDWKLFGFPWVSAIVGIHWFHPTENHRDPDNIIASLKPTIDGIKRAGLLVDDNELTWCSPVRLTDKSNPRVEIVLEKPLGVITPPKPEVTIDDLPTIGDYKADQIGDDEYWLDGSIMFASDSPAEVLHKLQQLAATMTDEQFKTVLKMREE